MAEKILKNVKGIGKAPVWAGSYANFPLGDDLAIGTLVCMHSTGELKAVTAASEKVPVGVVYLADITGDNIIKYSGDATLDAQKLKKGYRLDLYKQFLMSGVELSEGWGNVKVGQPVYFKIEDGQFYITKGSVTNGFRVGRVERVGDQMVRFDLLNMVGQGSQADK